MFYMNRCLRCSGSMVMLDEVEERCIKCLHCGRTIDDRMARRLLARQRKSAVA